MEYLLGRWFEQRFRPMARARLKKKIKRKVKREVEKQEEPCTCAIINHLAQDLEGNSVKSHPLGLAVGKQWTNRYGKTTTEHVSQTYYSRLFVGVVVGKIVEVDACDMKTTRFGLFPC